MWPVKAKVWGGGVLRLLGTLFGEGCGVVPVGGAARLPSALLGEGAVRDSSHWSPRLHN